jgi:NurA domain-containing protein
MNANAHLNFYLEEDCITEFENTFRKSMKMCLANQLEEILKGRRIIFDSIEQTTVPVRRQGSFEQACAVTPMVLQPSEEITYISAIDSSVIHLARTEEGRLYAAKSGVVISSGRRIRRHIRLGPMLIYLTEEFLDNSKIDHNLGNILLVDSSIAKRLIRIRLERAIQLVLSNRLNNSIILIDGALRPSVFEDYSCTINKVIEMSTLSNNDVIGLSKNTSMTILNQFESLLKTMPYSACIDTDCVIKSLARNTLGNNMLVKLGKNENEYVLRADICSANGNDLECLERLIGNDILFRSYPESLRIAHHISTFTTTEVSSLKGFISRSYGAEEVDQTATRKNILGVSFV